MPGYRIRVTAQLSEWTAVDEARVRAQTGGVIKPLALDPRDIHTVRIDLDSTGRNAQCAAERAMQRLEASLAPTVRLMRSAAWVARRRGPLRLAGRSAGLWPGGDDDDGLAGVREPRRPAPSAGSAAAAVDPNAA